jgi:hypothetical protein
VTSQAGCELLGVCTINNGQINAHGFPGEEDGDHGDHRGAGEVQEHRTTPLATDCEAPDESEDHQQRRRPVTDLTERRKAAHQEGGDTHQQ